MGPSLSRLCGPQSDDEERGSALVIGEFQVVRLAFVSVRVAESATWERTAVVFASRRWTFTQWEATSDWIPYDDVTGVRLSGNNLELVLRQWGVVCLWSVDADLIAARFLMRGAAALRSC